MYLLDTGMLFDLREARRASTDPALALWAERIPAEQMFLSRADAARARERRRDRRAARQDLGLAWREWLDGQVLPAFEDPRASGRRRGVRRRAQIPYADDREGVLAATALVHNLTLVTSETRKYRAGRVKVLDPRALRPRRRGRRRLARSDPLRRRLAEEPADPLERGESNGGSGTFGGVLGGWQTAIANSVGPAPDRVGFHTLTEMGRWHAQQDSCSGLVRWRGLAIPCAAQPVAFRAGSRPGRLPPSVPRSVLERYVGRYELNGTVVTVGLTDDDRLTRCS